MNQLFRKIDMANSNNQKTQLSLRLFKRVARIALLVSLFSLLTFGVMVASLDSPSGDYFNMLSSLTSSKDNFIFIVMLTGALLVSATAATTYVITLYSGFRVAGPMFRFAQNLKLSHQDEHPRPYIGIRNHDHFHAECQLMETSNNILLSHYTTLSQAIYKLEALTLDDASNAQTIIEQTRVIQEIEQRLEQ